VDRQNCALVDPGDAESAVEAVRWLLQDKVTRAAMVKHGRETAREFDWWPIAEKHAAVYRGLLG